MGDRVGVQIAALVEAVPTPLPIQKVAYEKGSAGWTEHNRVRVALREWLENRCPWPSESEYTVAEPEGASGGPGPGCQCATASGTGAAQCQWLPLSLSVGGTGTGTAAQLEVLRCQWNPATRKLKFIHCQCRPGSP